MESQGGHYVAAWRNGLNFTGYATRTQYWTFVLINLAIGIAVGIVVLIAALADVRTVAVIVVALGGLFGLAALLPSIAVTFRRVRDATGTGLWMLLWFVPVVGGLIVQVILPLMPTKSET